MAAPKNVTIVKMTKMAYLALIFWSTYNPSQCVLVANYKYRDGLFPMNTEHNKRQVLHEFLSINSLSYDRVYIIQYTTQNCSHRVIIRLRPQSSRLLIGGFIAVSHCRNQRIRQAECELCAATNCRWCTYSVSAYVSHSRSIMAEINCI